MRLISIVLLTLAYMQGFAQYTDNPLLGKHWATLSGGLNTADNVSWQACASAAMRGETMMTQARIAYSQELIEVANDTCTFRKNNLTELAVMWGDGWGGKHWYVTGTLGFGFNVRMYCDDKDYGGYRYLTAVTIGLPAQIDVGVLFGKYSGITLSMLGNWNFRQAYAGAHLGFTRRF